MIYDLQKASLSKRLSAFLFDFVILIIIAVGAALTCSAVIGYDDRLSELDGYCQEYYSVYEEKYGFGMELTNSEYLELTDEDKARYNAAQDELEAEVAKDERINAITVTLFNMTLIITSLSLFVAFLINEFVLPLVLKNGQTLGKKIFGVALMRDDSVKVTPVMMFVRSILGKYTVETMVPVFLIVLTLVGGAGIIGLAALVLLLAYNVILFVRTKNKTFIHDLLAYTVAVDIHSQMIFETKEEMMAYKNKIHADIVDKTE